MKPSFRIDFIHDFYLGVNNFFDFIILFLYNIDKLDDLIALFLRLRLCLFIETPHISRVLLVFRNECYCDE
jgi:hypothetical protein